MPVTRRIGRSARRGRGVMGSTGRGTLGIERMLLALKSRGLVPDPSGMFIVDRRVALNSLDIETLGRVCTQCGYDWKYLEDVA
jgi:hypothetical protein